MTIDATTDWVRSVLVRHDPAGAWKHDPQILTNDYTQEARGVAERLNNVLGLGHIFTLIADSIDQGRPGFYQAVADDSEIHRRVALAARELWDGRGAHLGIRQGQAASRPSIAGAVSATIPDPPSSQELVADGEWLEGWLRTVENGLASEPNPFSNPGPWTKALRAALPGLVDSYASADNSERAAMRLAFSRFRRALHTLSGVAAGQLASIDTSDSEGSLRRGLMAESLLDLGTDWRDELLMLRDARSRAAAALLPFAERAEEAAAASSARTATFLRNFLAERE
ncbi:MAG TPA: hypothetical protein VKT80_06270 [Chloroflexota bacterium]|nr:hypothetical protein [Chloroflexota bacterium]